jgi:hypothetical protein
MIFKSRNSVDGRESVDRSSQRFNIQDRNWTFRVDDESIILTFWEGHRALHGTTVGERTLSDDTDEYQIKTNQEEKDSDSHGLKSDLIVWTIENEHTVQTVRLASACVGVWEWFFTQVI